MSNSTKLFRINGPDLSLLEQGVAILHDAASLSPAYSRGDVQVAIEEVKRIMSDVRWDYGPFSHVEHIPAVQPPEIGTDDD